MIQKLLNKPLMLAPQSLETIAGIEWFTADREILSYNIYSDVAVIPIHGLLTKRPELFSSFFETTSYEEIHEMLLWCSPILGPL